MTGEDGGAWGTVGSLPQRPLVGASAGFAVSFSLKIFHTFKEGLGSWPSQLEAAEGLKPGPGRSERDLGSLCVKRGGGAGGSLKTLRLLAVSPGKVIEMFRLRLPHLFEIIE